MMPLIQLQGIQDGALASCKALILAVLNSVITDGPDDDCHRKAKHF
jgi:hypothetical protein